eukprot:jgi/Tetstr1/426558/TSEL_001634.t1
MCTAAEDGDVIDVIVLFWQLLSAPFSDYRWSYPPAGGGGSDWEYEGSDEEGDLELSLTNGRVLTAPERLVKHGTVARGAAYCLPCLAEAEAFNITDVDGGQPTGLLYKRPPPGSGPSGAEDHGCGRPGGTTPTSMWIPSGTLCRSCKQDAISRFIPQDVEAEKTVYKKGTTLYIMKVVYNVVTLPTVKCGQWNLPREFQTDIKKYRWPRRPPPEYAKPRTAIEAKLQAGPRRNWKEQHDAGVSEADMLVSAEIALYMRNVAHEEVTPAATPAGSPTQRQPDGRKPRRADGTVGKNGGVSNTESPSMLRDAGMLKDTHARLEREQRKRVREGKKMLADRKTVVGR